MRVVLNLGFAIAAIALVATPAFAGDVPAPVPEPASMALLGTAAAALGFRAYRNRNR